MGSVESHTHTHMHSFLWGRGRQNKDGASCAVSVSSTSCWDSTRIKSLRLCGVSLLPGFGLIRCYCLFFHGLCCDFVLMFVLWGREDIFIYSFIAEGILLCCPLIQMWNRPSCSVLYKELFFFNRGTHTCTCTHTYMHACKHTPGPTAERKIILLISAKSSESGAQMAARCRNRRQHLQHNSVLSTSSSFSSSLPSCTLSSSVQF